MVRPDLSKWDIRSKLWDLLDMHTDPAQTALDVDIKRQTRLYDPVIIKELAKILGVNEREIYRWQSFDNEPCKKNKRRIQRAWFYYCRGY
ncbi:hypothetical protein LCGC14_1317510 [marine sediment metagenome]|uniref:Uncharacterized protein n=1 Tax=marine sediment metagenome TaxID=412755 RepID=A0A0F9KKH6_9ZZZZ